MNIAITDGLQLMPPAFRAGLSVWSSGDGTPGSATWASASNAAIVPADQDFGTCLEIIKTSTTTRIRFKGETPMIPGVYLRISARLKAMAGARPSVRIAGWAGDGQRNHVDGLPETGQAVALPGYGQIIEVSAIVGVGARNGVDLSWGAQPVYGHFGLDLTGSNGGAVRIESIRIEDVTSAFLPELIDWVDVRDFGAVGNGVADDRAAFLAADSASQGREILVPEGVFRIGSTLSINAPIRFVGRLTAPTDARISFLQSFDFPTYADAFADETLGLKKAIQALLGFTDHVSLDLRGRRVDLTEPVVVSEVAPGVQNFFNRRNIINGEIRLVEGPAWNTRIVTSQATYDTADSQTLSNVINVAAIEVGSRIEGNGVGREVYVSGRDVAQRTLTLSAPLHGGSGTRSYTFHRYRYALDFSDVNQIQRFGFSGIVFNCDSIGSAVMLPGTGGLFSFRDCMFEAPKDRGITSIGRGCQGLLVDQCDFRSSETALLAHERKSIAINVNANDAKIRHNRFVRFAHFMVTYGGGHIITGNHWFQGDASEDGLRTAGLVLTQVNPMITISGNYVDNASIEWTNEHSVDPAFVGGGHSFGGLTISNNTFLCDKTVAWFSWLVIKPFGSGQFVHGMNVSGNVFKSLYTKVDRIERVDTTHADLDYTRMRNIRFSGNSLIGVKTYVENPVTVTHTQNTASRSWTLPAIEGLPFLGWAKVVQSVVLTAALTQDSGAQVYEMPWLQTSLGATKRQVRLNWGTAVKGRVSLQLRMDNPD
ncbi:right-handed parallel beta-helix repeat-containing protein [Paracoccus sp. M683]|uniref:glycosyl hydrolase family 28-related protein n=1 Tax=Paracoccus sp. M683 TaxID=2594268 RepID=UPI00117C7F1C|nr:glycosyl hydrolase family 28-related protein [Paracoccus sp. M683]TRW97762.1 right-handed parallel beta-helix repeat-containing protein [Paracoccus sp. M683]